MTSKYPNNLEAEKAVLGGMISSPDLVAEIAGDLSPEDFYNPTHGHLWNAFIEMRTQGANEIDIVELCERSGNVIDPTQMVGIQIESVAFNRSQVDIILRHSAARQLIIKGNETVRNLMDGVDPYETAADLERFSSRLGSESSSVEQEAMTLMELVENADSIAPVVIPGLCNRDYRTIVVAEEGAGKSLLLRTIAQATAQGIHPFSHQVIPPKRTLVVDLENPAQAIIDTSVTFEFTLEARAGSNYDPERFRIWRRPGGINIRKLADRAALQREIAYHRPELVCIGPIYKMYARTGGESYEDSADDAMRVLDELRTKYDFALFMEHHAAKGKSGEGRDLAPMGSQRWMAWPEIGISLYKDRQDPTSFDVKRFRGDRLSGVGWPDRIVRNRNFLVDGVWTNGIPNTNF